MTALQIARSYIGKKEKPGNSGFEDPAFEMDMLNEGWQRGWSWCAIFLKLVFKKAFPLKAKDFDKLFSPGAVATFNNFKKAGFVITDHPFAGAIVVWKHYDNGVAHAWKGHIGIVTEVINPTTFKATAGNTSGPNSSNGELVGEHTHTTAFKKDGLNVLGFIKVIQ
jgi:hypothetical protein